MSLSQLNFILSGADAATDHNLAAMTNQFQLKFIRKKKQSMKRWDREALKTRVTT